MQNPQPPEDDDFDLDSLISKEPKYVDMPFVAPTQMDALVSGTIPPVAQGVEEDGTLDEVVKPKRKKGHTPMTDHNFKPMSYPIEGIVPRSPEPVEIPKMSPFAAKIAERDRQKFAERWKPTSSLVTSKGSSLVSPTKSGYKFSDITREEAMFRNFPPAAWAEKLQQDVYKSTLDRYRPLDDLPEAELVMLVNALQGRLLTWGEQVSVIVAPKKATTEIQRLLDHLRATPIGGVVFLQLSTPTKQLQRELESLKWFADVDYAWVTEEVLSKHDRQTLQALLRGAPNDGTVRAIKRLK